MRVGFNPNKDKEIKAGKYTHQVIIPVHIPNDEKYFKDSFKIFKISLESICITSHKKTFITVVNNRSSLIVIEYLNQLYFENKIHEIIHTTQKGKLNAVYKGLAGSNFKLVTITDADVLFTHNWQLETYLVFETFKKVGVVCTTPSSKSFKVFTSNIWIENLFNKNLMFSQVLNKQALLDFAKSIGNKNFYNKFHLSKYLTIKKGNIKAVIGAGHFVATYRRDIFENRIQLYTKYNLGGDSEIKMLDIPVVKKGYWRLSTLDNFTWHMGNVFETWMEEKIDSIRQTVVNQDVGCKLNKEINQTYIMYLLKEKFLKKIIFQKYIFKALLKSKGLNSNEIDSY